jgi:hypothetical protein
MNTLVAIPATYDYRLVSLSVVIAIFASYTALGLAGRVTATRDQARLAWLDGGIGGNRNSRPLQQLVGKAAVNDVGLLVQYRVAARLAVESSAP